MAGLVVFRTLREAVNAGYQVYDRTADGFIVRTRVGGQWALAFVRER